MNFLVELGNLWAVFILIGSGLFVAALVILYFGAELDTQSPTRVESKVRHDGRRFKYANATDERIVDSHAPTRAADAIAGQPPLASPSEDRSSIGRRNQSEPFKQNRGASRLLILLGIGLLSSGAGLAVVGLAMWFLLDFKINPAGP